MASKFDTATIARIGDALAAEGLTIARRPTERTPGGRGVWYDVLKPSRTTGYATVATLSDKGVSEPLKDDGSSVGWSPSDHAERMLAKLVKA